MQGSSSITQDNLLNLINNLCVHQVYTLQNKSPLKKSCKLFFFNERLKINTKTHKYQILHKRNIFWEQTGARHIKINLVRNKQNKMQIIFIVYWIIIHYSQLSDWLSDAAQRGSHTRHWFCKDGDLKIK